MAYSKPKKRKRLFGGTITKTVTRIPGAAGSKKVRKVIETGEAKKRRMQRKGRPVLERIEKERIKKVSITKPGLKTSANGKLKTTRRPKKKVERTRTGRIKTYTFYKNPKKNKSKARPSYQ